MPKLSAHQSAKITKMILIGDSGTGKTGALTSLAEAGYNLRILDLDNGLDVLVNYLRASQAKPIDGITPLERVDFITITDKFKHVGGKATPVNSNTWARAIKYLDRWTNKGETLKGTDPEGKPINIIIDENHPDFFDLGKPEEWGPDSILVVDSFTFLCNAAMRFVLKLNNRPAGPTYESDWNEAQQLVENLLAMLYSSEFATNVVVCAHIAVRTEKDGTTTAFPSALGKALPPKVGRYFNAMLEVRRTGTGNAMKRTIHTVPAGLLELKNPNPVKVKSAYDIKDGLAEYFKAVRTG